MSLGLLWRTVLRDSRGARGRLVFFVLCLSVGVAAVVGVAGLSGAVADGVRAQSRQILGGDLAVESRRPLPAEVATLLPEAAGVERTDVRDLATMVSGGAAPDEALDGSRGPGPSRLAELRVVDGRYPLYGGLELDPARPLDELLDAESAVLAPELASALGVGVGGSISIGGAPFRVAGLVAREPDRLGFSLSLGPRAVLDAEGFARTSLERFGSRIRHRALYALPAGTTPERIAELEEQLESGLPGASYLRVETSADAQPDLRRSIRRVERWLGLAALLSLVLGGAGVAWIVRAWMARRTAEIAVLRCLGMRAREIALVSLGNVALLALAGSLAGAAAGSSIVFLVPRLAPEFFPPELVRPWQPAAVLRGLALGIGIAAFASLLPLSAVWRVPPARVLRAEIEPLPASRAVRALAAAALALAVFAAAWWQSDEASYAAAFTGGFAVLSLLLSLAARGLARASSWLPRERFPAYLRHGIAALARPGAGTTGATVAIGLGAMVVVAMVLVEGRLRRELAGALPRGAPSVFLVDVQPDQWPGVRAALEAEGATSIDSVPVLTARLARIDGRAVEELAGERADGERRRPRWVLTREQRLTWLSSLPEGNRVLDALPPADGAPPASSASPWIDPGRAEISLEAEYAEDLGVRPGSTLAFDVQGIEVEMLVSSVRSVDWKTFGINFFLLAEPGVLERAPHFRIAAARLDPRAEGPLQDRVASAYPNVTLLRVRAILEKLADVLDKLGLAVRVLGGFTVVTGLAILAGVVAAAAAHRGKEVALLKTLGLTRRGVAGLFAVEHALVGLVSGAIGAAGAWVLASAFVSRALELEPDLPPAVPLCAALGCAALTALSGIAASARALAVPPIESLRA